jgi:hypothetical protein
MRWLVVFGIGLMALAACSDPQPREVVAIATRTLIPPTTTPTLVPLDTTPTPTDLPSAAALSIATPTSASLALIPAAAQAMIDQTMADLVTQPRIDPADIRLLSLDELTWRNDSWGCRARYDAGYIDPAVVPGYRIVYSAGQRAYVYHTDQDGAFFLCDDQDWLALEGEPIPLDPIAQAMVDLCIHDISKRLETPEETDIQLISLVMVNWPDSSIGCPRAAAEYEDTLTPGYRMVFRAGDDTLIYHTSIRQVLRCTLDEEILPGLLRRALPTPDENQRKK